MENKKRLDLIDRGALKRSFCSNCNAEYSEEPCEPSECLFCNTVDQQPRVDAVEVVRCKECKNRIYSVLDGCYVCHLGGFNAINPYHFCSYGERKDNVQT